MEHADLADLKMEQWLRMRNSGELVWKTKSGNEIPIRDMSDLHLENAITMLERNEEMSFKYAAFYDANEDAGDRI